MPENKKSKIKFWTPAGIVCLYGFFGVLWIVLSDRGILLLFRDQDIINQAQTYKGWFFVFVTTLFLYGLIRRLIEKQSITEKKLQQIEDRLIQNERLLQETGKMAKMGGWEVDPISGETIWTQGIYEIFEVDENWNRKPDSIFELFEDTSRERLKAAFDAALTQGKSYDLELKILTPLGHEKWVRIMGKADIKDNQILRVWGWIQDISETVESKEVLRQSEERYRMVLDNTGEIYFEVDLSGNFTYLSQYAMDRFVKNEDPKASRQSRSYIPPKDAERITEIFNHIYRTGESVSNFEYAGQLFDDEKRVFQLSAALMKDRSGSPIGFHGLSRDITEKRRAEEENENLKNQLHQAQKLESVGRLAGGVAHDFNNLLSVVLGYSELIQDELDENHPYYESLAYIKSAALRAKDLTSQLLAFSRKQILETKILDVNHVVNNFEKFIKRMIGEDIELEMNLYPNSLQVEADKAQLEQVLMNLSVNARDAMPDGGKLIIETSLTQLDESYTHNRPVVEPGTYAMIAISDSGYGMDAETMDKIFEPFFTTKGQDRGTGLGLSTSYGIVKQHRGNIWVYSETGKGTTFKIYLPIYKGDEQTKKAKLSPKRETSGGAETILVVEDDITVRKMIVKMLSNRGYHVIESHNVEDALEKAEKYNGTIHLLLTDVIMPGMKGPEVKEKIEIFYPDIKVLYMSGYTDNVIVRHGVLMEDVQFIQKPFTAKGLVDRINQLMG